MSEITGKLFIYRDKTAILSVDGDLPADMMAAIRDAWDDWSQKRSPGALLVLPIPLDVIHMDEAVASEPMPVA